MDGDGLLKKEKNKSLLIHELEKKAPPDIIDRDSQIETASIVDVMLVLRQIKWKGLETFKHLANSFCDRIILRAGMQNTKIIDFVFDSYFEDSPKHSERFRRKKSDSINYHKIEEEIILPKQEDTFWGSSHDKILLQKFL
ncbi:hypothetical protein QAD02_012999 [Eretmocerus hayati]|uniref:Uncharacterized protein n=1 Tax=Eretmocerus hayati TaxID=131215 RepID=A0ACC2P1H7_9HYME|nr:hypothetical protein QAD02_012999 [Eretmocerus hayati]